MTNFASRTGILGLGLIGLATAERAAAFGMRILACNRTTSKHVPVLDAPIYPLSELKEMAAECDCAPCFLLRHCLQSCCSRPLASNIRNSQNDTFEYDRLVPPLQILYLPRHSHQRQKVSPNRLAVDPVFGHVVATRTLLSLTSKPMLLA